MKKLLSLILIIIFLNTLFACTYNTIKDKENEIPKDEEPSEEELLHQKIQNIIEKMTLEDKIGQMFMVGFNGTDVGDSLNKAIENQRFGNFIYFGYNVTDDSKIANLSSSIQNKVIDEIGIPAFISIDQEGGLVTRFSGSQTHFIGSMGLVATNNSDNAYNVAKYSGLELRHFGINVNLAPSLDVNNNPSNQVIGIRSYSDNPQVVSEYGLKMINGYKEVNVLSTIKHFPGHGDTVVDSHYGLPIIKHDKERLYEVELAPFIEAINAGVDSIMTAHIIFSAFDNELPATLSYKVITELLREELGYEGIIMTDEMRMNAILNNFGIEEAAIKAILAGVDILLYSESKSTSIQAYKGVLQAVKDDIISEDRINASVYRILEKKIKYGLLENYEPRLNLGFSDFEYHKTYNQNLIEKSLTLAKGNVDWFSKNKSTLLISPICTRYPLLPGYNVNSQNNSFANVGKIYLNEKEVEQVDSYVIGTSITDSEINEIINMAKGYDQIIIAVENVSSSQATLINRLGNNNSNMLVVALKNPYDLLSYNNVDNYICTYGYFTGTVQATMDLLLGKFAPTGKLPVKIKEINN